MCMWLPVIAYWKWWATETVVDGETGIFFDSQTVPALENALEKYETIEWNKEKIYARGKMFSKEIFQKNIHNYIESYIKNDQCNNSPITNI
jgi:glycosyltransferase involved in cell wall biosynthesis